MQHWRTSRHPHRVPPAPRLAMPCDRKHAAWLVVSAAVIEALDQFELDDPKVTGKALKELKARERALKGDGGK